jgi:hypothetical protein
VLIYYLYRARPPAFGIGLLPLLFLPLLALAAQPNLLIERTFYGVIRVQESAVKRTLLHGITNHGSQYIEAPRSKEPTSYYHRDAPYGNSVDLCRKLTGCHSIGVLGLGVGTIASYGLPGDTITFYEIDPAITKIATDPRYFTYLRDSQASIKIVMGDGRLSLAHGGPAHDIIMLDAFSSDAIPTHLLTREALAMYASRLTERGILAVHISNRQLDLEPIVRATALDAGFAARVRYDSAQGADRFASKLVILAKDPATLAPLAEYPDWRELKGRSVRPWTDDYSNILDALHW